MRRRVREGSLVVDGDADEEADNSVRVTYSQYSSETPTPTEMQRARKRGTPHSFWRIYLLHLKRGVKSNSDYYGFNWKLIVLNSRKRRAATHDRNEEKRFDIISAQADLQRQQQSDSARIQLKMLQEMVEMMKRRDQ
jgi:hypothetical protein